MLAVGQPQPQGNKKTRNVAKTDATSVNHRKISVQYTEGLKAYYSGNMSEALKIFNGILLDNPKHVLVNRDAAGSQSDKRRRHHYFLHCFFLFPFYLFPASDTGGETSRRFP